MWIHQEEEDRQKNVLNNVIVPTHLLIIAPNHARVYENGEFICDATAKYRQHSADPIVPVIQQSGHVLTFFH